MLILSLLMVGYDGVALGLEIWLAELLYCHRDARMPRSTIA